MEMLSRTFKWNHVQNKFYYFAITRKLCLNYEKIYCNYDISYVYRFVELKIK